MLQVAAYCRVSTDKEDQANSFEAQQRYFREYIQRQPDWELQGIYADEGFSGTSTNKRVEFNKMLHAAELGQIDLIVTKEVSRFTRNTVDALQITRELRRRGVGVLFLNDSLDTRTNDGELRLTIMSSFAQDESRRTSERSKWGQMRSMEKGVVFGGSLLGYDVIGGKMTVNPEGAEVVRLIFHKYLQERKGCSTIARELREAGILSSKGNCLWSSATVTKILKNEKYCGDLIQKKTYTPDFLTHEKKYNHGKEPLVELKDHHEPIIDRETWQAVQRELSGLYISTIGQLAAADPSQLFARLGKHGRQLYDYANGLDDSPVRRADAPREIKSVGNGMTFRRDLSGERELRTGIAVLSDEVAGRLRRYGLCAATIQLQIKDTRLRVISRQRPLPRPTALASELAGAAMELVRASWDMTLPVRMLTVAACNLVEASQASEQLSLFDESDPAGRGRRLNLERTVDSLRGRFGRGIIAPGSVVNNELMGYSQEEEE